MSWKDRFDQPVLTETTVRDDGTIQLQHIKDRNIWQLSIKGPSGYQFVDVTNFVTLYNKTARSYEIPMAEFVIAAYSGWVNAALQTHGKMFVMTAKDLKLPKPETVAEMRTYDGPQGTNPKDIQAELEFYAKQGFAPAVRILDILETL